MYQYNDLFKAVGLLLLIFLGGYMFSKFENKRTYNAQISILNEKKSYETKIHTIDSTIARIPFTGNDSQRTEFLKNYSKFR